MTNIKELKEEYKKLKKNKEEEIKKKKLEKKIKELKDEGKLSTQIFKLFDKI